jgi:hypothetical protein
MNIKETTILLGWKREVVQLAITDGIETPISRKCVKLAATPQGNDYDITEEAVDTLLAAFEKEEPSRHPPVSVRRALLIESRYKCAVCRSDAPLQFHHIIEWAQIQHHDPVHMLAVCGTCHDKITLGYIDTKAQLAFKEELTGEAPQPVAATPARPAAPPPAKDEVIDEAAAERVVWCLPRGFLILEDVEYDSRPDWAVVAHYYHFGEGWRAGTHFHDSYLRSWEESNRITKQFYKVGIPKGDWDDSYRAFQLMMRLRCTDKTLNIKAIVEDLARGGSPVRYYSSSEPILASHVEGKYPGLNGIHALRDLTAELSEFEAADYTQAVSWLAADQAFSFSHRALLEAEAFLGKGHTSLQFISKVVDQFDPEASTADLKRWVKRLRQVLKVAVEAGAKSRGQ